MRNLLAFVAASLLVFLGLGYYLDWYRIDKLASSQSGQQITIDLNSRKIAEDVHRGAEQGAEGVKKFLENRHLAETSDRGPATAGEAGKPAQHD